MDVAQRNRFEDLSSTDFLRILSYLEAPDVLQCERVCSNFQSHATSDDVWLGLFREGYPSLDLSVLFQFNDRQASKTYKQLVSSFFESRQGWLRLSPFRSTEMGHYDPPPLDEVDSHRKRGKTSRVGFNKVVSLSQHGNMVAVGTQRDGVRIFRDVNGALLRSLEGPRFPCSFTHFVPDASLFVGLSDDGVLHGWNLKGKTSTMFEDPVHTRPPHAFFGGRKWIVSGGLDRRLGMWRLSDIQNGTRFARLDVLGSEIECIDMDEKNGIVVSGGFNNVVACSVLPPEVCDEREWAPELPRENPSPEGVVTAHLIGHRSKVNVVRFYNNPSTLFSASNDKSVRLWDLHSMSTVQEFLGHRNAVSCIGFSTRPLGTVLVTGSLDKNIRLFDVEMGMMIASMPVGGKSEPRFLHVDQEKIIVSNRRDDVIRALDMRSMELSGSLLPPFPSVGGERFNVTKCVVVEPHYLLAGYENGRTFLFDFRKPSTPVH